MSSQTIDERFYGTVFGNEFVSCDLSRVSSVNYQLEYHPGLRSS
jgi:hypothetical protein